MPVAVAVVGGKKSGKTTTIEILTKKLTERGFKIAAVKHIPEANFTIDMPGKDTWRYAQSGAKIVIGASVDEIAMIEKKRSRDGSLKEILRKCRDCDLVFLEGFRGQVAKKKSILKIVLAGSTDEAMHDLKTFSPILAFVGRHKFKSGKYQIPFVDARKDPEGLADIVEKVIVKNTAT